MVELKCFPRGAVEGTCDTVRVGAYGVSAVSSSQHTPPPTIVIASLLTLDE